MRKALLLALLSLPLALAGCGHSYPAYYGPPAPDYNQIAQRGFHDGVDAARHDISARRAPDVDRHPRFRNPPVPPPAFEDYRRGFREGYQSTFRNGPPPPPPGYYH